jgi:hypothetical protein
VSTNITVVYATSAGAGKSVTASCPTGDVAIGGGGSSHNESHYTTSGPVNSTTTTPPTTGSGSYSAAPTGWFFSNQSDSGPVTAYVICSK